MIAVQLRKSTLNCMLLVVPHILQEQACSGNIPDPAIRRPWTTAEEIVLDIATEPTDISKNLLSFLKSTPDRDTDKLYCSISEDADEPYNKDLPNFNISIQSEEDEDNLQTKNVLSEGMDSFQKVKDVHEENDWLLEELQTSSMHNAQLLGCISVRTLMSQLKPKVLQDPLGASNVTIEQLFSDDAVYEPTERKCHIPITSATETFTTERDESSFHSYFLDEDIVFSDGDICPGSQWITGTTPEHYKVREILDLDTETLTEEETDETVHGKQGLIFLGNNAVKRDTLLEEFCSELTMEEEDPWLTELHQQDPSLGIPDFVRDALIECPTFRLTKLVCSDVKLEKPWRKLPRYQISMDDVQMKI